MLRHLIAAAILLAVAIAGCHDPVAPDYEYAPARVAGFVDGDPQWSFTVDEGRITVSVATFGNSCVRKGDLHVAIDPEAREVSVRAVKVPHGARARAARCLVRPHAAAGHRATRSLA